MFNIGKTTARECFIDVLLALNQLKGTFIRFPRTLAERQAVIDTFSFCKLPNILGAIDGTHVKVRAPRNDPEDYYSRYHQHDVVAQAVVDGTRRFMDIAAGYAGRMHDARILRCSSINEVLQYGFDGPAVTVNDIEILPYLIGDSAYPISNTLLKPYSDKTTDPKEKKFNKEFSKARVSVECAFGMMKSRFIILKGIQDSMKYVSMIIIACAVMHNICIDLGDEWPEEQEPDDTLRGLGVQDSYQGEEIRAVLTEWLYAS